jgi:hypothetical protein
MPNYKLIVGDYREEMEYGPDYDWSLTGRLCISQRLDS